MTEKEIREYNSKCTNSENYELSYVGSYGITVYEHATGDLLISTGTKNMICGSILISCVGIRGHNHGYI